jgi:hypothetical protein
MTNNELLKMAAGLLVVEGDNLDDLCYSTKSGMVTKR